MDGMGVCVWMFGHVESSNARDRDRRRRLGATAPHGVRRKRGLWTLDFGLWTMGGDGGGGRARDRDRRRARGVEARWWWLRGARAVVACVAVLAVCGGCCARGVGASAVASSSSSSSSSSVNRHEYDAHGPDGEVLALGEVNFDEYVGKGAPVLVKVYAEWCKHCRAMTTTWNEVARELEGEVYVGKIDGPKNRLLVKRIGVKGYPTIALFKQGKLYEYESSDRSFEALVAFARKDHRKFKSRSFFHAVWFSKVLRGLYAIPEVGGKAHAYLHEDLKLSNVAILFLTLSVPVSAGMIAIFVADMVIVRHVLKETRQMYSGGRNAAARRPHAD